MPMATVLTSSADYLVDRDNNVQIRLADSIGASLSSLLDWRVDGGDQGSKSG